MYRKFKEIKSLFINNFFSSNIIVTSFVSFFADRSLVLELPCLAKSQQKFTSESLNHETDKIYAENWHKIFIKLIVVSNIGCTKGFLAVS